MGKLFSVVEIETASVCNLRCEYCPNAISERSMAKNGRQMPETLYFRIIDELVAIGFAGEIHPHLYNEPLLDPRIGRLIRYTHAKLPGAKVVVFTNGIHLTLDRYQELVCSGVGRINITRHTPTEPPSVSAVLAHRSCAGDQGVEVVYNRNGISRGQIIFNRGGLIPIRKVIDPMLHCDWPSNVLTVNHDGDVLLCCNDYFASFSLGNLHNESIQRIWSAPPNRRLRNYLLHDTSKIDVCRRCQMGVY